MTPITENEIEQKQDNEMKAGITKRFIDETLEWIELELRFHMRRPTR